VAAVRQCGKAREVHARVAELQFGHPGVATRMTLGDVYRSRAVLRRRAGSPRDDGRSRGTRCRASTLGAW
jgi:hypothetical protein